MLMRVLILTGSLLFLCAALIAGTRTLARRDPPPRVAVLLPDPTCTVPCWQGLRPGAITSKVLAAWLDQPLGKRGQQAEPVVLATTRPGVIDSWQVTLPDAAPVILTTVRIHSREVDSLIVTQADLRVGDVIAALGEPAFIDFNLGMHSDLDYRLYYPEPRVIVEGTIQLDTWTLGPYTPASRLVYDGTAWARPVLAVDWQGFGSLTRYFGRRP
jgi:hypothetical protein